MNGVWTVNERSLHRQSGDVQKMDKLYPYIKETLVFSFYDAQPTIPIHQDQSMCID